MPGPRHGQRDRSLRLWFDPTAPDGFRVHSFAGDDPLVCRDYVREVLGLVPWRSGASARPRPMPRPVGNPAALDNRQRQRDKACWLWSQARPPIGTVVERYLREARGIDLLAMPDAIRHLPARPPTHPHPAMLAAFATDPAAHISVAGVHITRLRADGGGKAGTDKDKLMLGPSSGVPIVLAPPRDDAPLAITEGIEDALHVLSATSFGVWVAGSAGRMPALACRVPAFVGSAIVFSHDDEAGRRGANQLGKLLRERGVAVKIHIEPEAA
jgi:hypothetical protein